MIRRFTLQGQRAHSPSERWQGLIGIVSSRVLLDTSAIINVTLVVMGRSYEQ